MRKVSCFVLALVLLLLQLIAAPSPSSCLLQGAGNVSEAFLVAAWNGTRELIALTVKFDNINGTETFVQLVPLPSNASLSLTDETVFERISDILEAKRNYKLNFSFDSMAAPLNYTAFYANNASQAEQKLLQFLNETGVNDYYFEFNLTEFFSHYTSRNFTCFASAVYEVSANDTLAQPLVLEFSSRKLYLPLKSFLYPEANATKLRVAIVSNATFLFEGETYTTRVHIYGLRHYYLKFYATRYYYGLDLDPISSLATSCSRAELVKAFSHVRLKLKNELERLDVVFQLFNEKNMLLKLGSGDELGELNYVEVVSSMDYNSDFYGAPREMFGSKVYIGSREVYYGSLAPIAALLAAVAATAAASFRRKRKAS